MCDEYRDSTSLHDAPHGLKAGAVELSVKLPVICETVRHDVLLELLPRHEVEVSSILFELSVGRRSRRSRRDWHRHSKPTRVHLLQSVLQLVEPQFLRAKQYDRTLPVRLLSEVHDLVVREHFHVDHYSI